MVSSKTDLNMLTLQQQRQLLFTHCTSKEHLKNWIRTFLSTDNGDLCFPDSKVDLTSNSTVMDTLWLYYDTMVNRRLFKTDSGKTASRMLVYAARAAYKTLGCSVLEVLAILHGYRTCVHLAAIEKQVKAAQRYIKKFMTRPLIAPFVYKDNTENLEILWYEDPKTKETVSSKELSALQGDEKDRFSIIHHYSMLTAVGTINSVNSQHSPAYFCDELDLFDPAIFSESTMIASQGMDVYGRKQPALSYLTSTRKFASGLVMDVIDNAEQTGTIVKHWNYLDITERCPDHIYGNEDFAQKTMFVDEIACQSYSESEYADISRRETKIANRCRKVTVTEQCSQCPIFNYCAGILRDRDPNDTSALLIDIESTISMFQNLGDHDKAIAQLLCRRPGNEGAVYPTFNKETHVISANEIWEKITDIPILRKMTKEDLFSKFRDLGAKPAIGIDFGFNHPFAVVFAYLLNDTFYILDYIEVRHLSEEEQVKLLKSRYYYLNPTLWPDTAAAGAMNALRKAGFIVKSHNKQVMGGIESVRAHLKPVGSKNPRLFLLEGDKGCELLAKRILNYSMKRDAQGNPLDIPMEKDDDGCDALRYLVSNEGSTKVSSISTGESIINHTMTPEQNIVNELKQQILNELHEDITSPVISRGKFVGDFR